MKMKNSYLTVTDQFCGAGGSSSGAAAVGLEIKLALNHWQLAVETHNTNFPNTLHDCTDISASDPRRYPSTDILITSPECTNHSLAKGKARKYQAQLDLFGEITIDPAAERSRATMWDVPRFAEYHRYNIIIVENVVDARYWATWDAWLHAMDLLGYDHQVVYFNSMFAHPTPQSRDRMYVVFWKIRNRKPDLKITPPAFCPQCRQNVNAVQMWKNPSKPWGKYRQQYIYGCPHCDKQVEPYYYCALNALDFSIPIQRIGDRERPLKEKTLKRIQVGIDRFYGKPFTVETAYGSNVRRQYAADGPMPTQTTRQTMGVTLPPFLVGNYSPGWVRPTTAPTGAITTTDHHSLVVPPYMVEMYGTSSVRSLDEPVSTIVGAPHHGLVIPFLASYYGTCNVSLANDAVPTVTTKERHGLVVPPFLLGYYTRGHDKAAITEMIDAVPTQSTWPLHYLVQPSQKPSIDDCGFRMLEPEEIHRAMAFPETYTILGNKRERVKQLGNAVTPPVMAMLIKRCVESLETA